MRLTVLRSATRPPTVRTVAYDDVIRAEARVEERASSSRQPLP